VTGLPTKHLHTDAPHSPTSLRCVQQPELESVVQPQHPFTAAMDTVATQEDQLGRASSELSQMVTIDWIIKNYAPHTFSLTSRKPTRARPVPSALLSRSQNNVGVVQNPFGVPNHGIPGSPISPMVTQHLWHRSPSLYSGSRTAVVLFGTLSVVAKTRFPYSRRLIMSHWGSG
jgi:hypothetical protein